MATTASTCRACTSGSERLAWTSCAPSSASAGIVRRACGRHVRLGAASRTSTELAGARGDIATPWGSCSRRATVFRPHLERSAVDAVQRECLRRQARAGLATAAGVEHDDVAQTAAPPPDTMASNFKWIKKMSPRVTPPAANHDRSNDGFPQPRRPPQVFGGNAQTADVPRRKSEGGNIYPSAPSRLVPIRTQSAKEWPFQSTRHAPTGASLHGGGRE